MTMKYDNPKFDPKWESRVRGGAVSAERAKQKRVAGSGRKPAIYPDKCPNCKRSVRAPYETEVDKPGTVKAARASGQCWKCRNIETGKTKAKPMDPWYSLTEEQKDERVKVDRVALDGYMLERRRRGVPEEGLAVPNDPFPAIMPSMRDRDQITVQRLRLEARQRRTERERARARRRSMESQRKKRLREEFKRNPVQPYKTSILEGQVCKNGHQLREQQLPDGGKRKRCYQCEYDRQQARKLADQERRTLIRTRAA
jgi:hypothetical protein